MVPGLRLPLLTNGTFHQNETTPPKKRVFLLIYPMINPYPDKIKLFFVVIRFLSSGVTKFAQDQKKAPEKGG